MKQAHIYSILVCVALAFMCRHAAGQNTVHAIKFSSINTVGLVTGGNGQAVKLETVNGIAVRQFFAGVGAAIDYYGTRSVPLFLDVRQSFNNKKNSPFVYADGGPNFTWATNNQKFGRNYNTLSSSGYMFETGIGLELKLANARAIVLSAGYSLKTMKDKAESYTIWSFPTPQPLYDTYKYKYQRVVVKAGIRL